MRNNRSLALDHIVTKEGGLRVDPHEPGGASFRGVSLQSYSEYCTHMGKPEPTVTDLSAMSMDDTAAFYAWKVFDPTHFDELVDGLDYALADYAVKSGVGGALSACRYLLDVPLTVRRAAALWQVINPWSMEPALVAALIAAGQWHPVNAITALCDLRWARLQVDPEFTLPSSVPGKIIGDSWCNRVNDCWRWAMELRGFPAMPNRYTVAPNAAAFGAQ